MQLSINDLMQALKWIGMTNENEVHLNPTDRAALNMLAEGRCTAAYIADKNDYTRQNVRNRLQRLVEHGYVRRVHQGLYELINDPRENG